MDPTSSIGFSVTTPATISTEVHALERHIRAYNPAAPESSSITASIGLAPLPTACRGRRNAAAGRLVQRGQEPNAESIRLEFG